MTKAEDLDPRDDAWLEGLLKGDARDHDTYLADDGFTARVMSAIPAPITLPAWRRPVIALLWALAGIGLLALLPGAAHEAVQQVFRLVTAHRFTLTEVATAIMALSAATWMGGLYALRQG